MTNDEILGLLFWSSVILGVPLLIVSMMAVGKHVADLQYQIARRLNGIRWIQSWTNLRIHSNRVLFAIAFLSTSILGLFDVEVTTRIWVGRIGFLVVLLAFTISAFFDWAAEAKQLRILLRYEEINNIPKMRVELHALNNRIAEYFGIIAFIKKNDFQIKDVERLEAEIRLLVTSLQTDLHNMDPSYRTALHEGDVKNVNSTD